MAKPKVFVSFDYDHDSFLKEALVGQAQNPDSPFQISDWSVKEAQAYNWQDHAKMRISRSDIVVVICGQNTNSASGVSTELAIAKALNKPYFLLAGYKDKTNVRPRGYEKEKMYDWTWPNLKILIGGGR